MVTLKLNISFIPELPPEFTKKIEPLTVTAGEEKAIFEIELSKGDAITKWFKNGKEVELNERIHLKIDGKKQRLEIYNVEITDAGEFSCTIGNEKCVASLVRKNLHVFVDTNIFGPV